MAKFDIYEMVTNMIIEQLEKGVVPWKKGWTGSWDGAISRSTGQPYSFINQMLLGGREGEFLTFTQVQAENGKIKKGAKSNIAVYFSPYEKTQKNEQTGENEKITIPILKYYRVFHISDCENIKPKHNIEEKRVFAPFLNAEKLSEHYSTVQNMPIVHKKGDKAFYNLSSDEVYIPEKEQFLTAQDYYSTLFHEMAHSTGHKTRLDRHKNSTFGDTEYSKEELVAEISSSYLMNILGIETAENFENQASYIAGWLKNLKNDKKFIVSASSQAEKATKMIMEGFEFDYSDVVISETETTAVENPVEIVEELDCYDEQIENKVEEVIYHDEQIENKINSKNNIFVNKIFANAKDLFNAFSKVNNIKVKKSKITSLFTCEISVYDDKIQLHRSDLETDIIVAVNCQTSKDLEDKIFYVSNPESVAKILKPFKNEDIIIKVNENDIEFSSDTNTFKVLGSIVETKALPEILTQIKNEDTFKIKSDILKARLQNVWYVCSTENTKPICTGVIFDEQNLVALDGYRLSVNTGEKLSNDKFVVPKNALETVVKTFKKEIISISKTDDKFVSFESEDTKIIARLIDDTSFEYNKAIPFEFEYINKNNAEEILNALNYVSEFVKKDYKAPVKIYKNEISVISTLGEIKSTLSKEVFEDSDFIKGFNLRYLLQALKTCNNSEVEFKTSDKLSPLVIANKNTTHLILPVRLK